MLSPFFVDNNCQFGYNRLMMTNETKNVQIILNDTGDWVVVKVNDEVVLSDHRITVPGLYNLLCYLGVGSTVSAISDTEMEETYS